LKGTRPVGILERMTRIVGASFALALLGCGGGVVRPHSDDPMGGELCQFIPRDHLHDEVCGHYVYNSRWYYLSGHMHRPGCGHHHVNKTWVYVLPVKVPSDHRHDSFCGHYFHQGKWYHVAGHTHGHGCGHMYRNGFWQLD
jgi:hypothetical protein